MDARALALNRQAPTVAARCRALASYSQQCHRPSISSGDIGPRMIRTTGTTGCSFALPQLRMHRPRLLVNEAHGVADKKVNIPHVHFLACCIESESMADRYPGAIGRYPFGGALNMFEVVGDDFHHMKLPGFPTPLLADGCAAFFAFFGGAINSVEDRYAGQVGESNGAAVAVEIIERRIDDEFQVSREGIHIGFP